MHQSRRWWLDAWQTRWVDTDEPRPWTLSAPLRRAMSIVMAAVHARRRLISFFPAYMAFDKAVQLLASDDEGDIMSAVRNVWHAVRRVTRAPSSTPPGTLEH